MSNETTWTYTLTPRGSVEHECSVALQGDSLLWNARPTDPEEGKPQAGCEQRVADFREFGPPEVSVYLQMPTGVLDAICQSLGVIDPAWRQALPPDVVAWFAAVDRGHLDEMARRLAAGVDINVVDRQRRSALWHAADHENVAITRWLLERGADIESKDRYGQTVLIAAAWRRKEKLAEVYLEFGADKSARDSNGNPPWVVAVEAKAGGMFINSLRTDHPGDWDRALHAAAWISNAAWLEGDTWRADLHHPDINTKAGPFHRTALQECLLGYQPSPIAVRWLVEHGADLTVVDEGDGSTILHHAARLNFPWLAEPCLRAGVSAFALDKSGESPLSLALKGNEKTAFLRSVLQSSLPLDAEISETAIASRLDALRQQAFRDGLFWSWAVLGRTHWARDWAGLCGYARIHPLGEDINTSEPSPGTFWVEFPGNWLGYVELYKGTLAKVLKRRTEREFQEPVFLSQEEAKKQPWAWPGRELLAALPEPWIEPVVRFRDERPRATMTDPAAWVEGGLEELDREWHWQAPDWNACLEKCSLRLRHGIFVWEGDNTHVEQPISRFRIEGPPAGSGFHRSLPRDTLDEICALIAETERIWERPSSNQEREARVEKWKEAERQKPVEKQPDPVPHQSGLWCYAELSVEDVLISSSGAPSASQAWVTWMEFPAEWCAVRRPLRESWLVKALGHAYAAMNALAAGERYQLRDCRVSILTPERVREQPWTATGKVLYTTDEHLTPRVVPDGEKQRPLEAMGNPAEPPNPVPISPPPYRGNIQPSA